jgi:hypothetical protein
MSDTILRRAHMSAIQEVSSLNQRIKRLEAGLVVAECMNQYLAARLQLHGKPYKMDTAVLTLGQAAIDVEDNAAAQKCIDALRELMGLARKFTDEAIKEHKSNPDLYSDDQTTVDGIIRSVLQSVDKKLLAHRDAEFKKHGFTEDDLKDLIAELERDLGLGGKDSE